MMSDVVRHATSAEYRLVLAASTRLRGILPRVRAARGGGVGRREYAASRRRLLPR